MDNFPRELAHDSGATMRLDPSRLLLRFREAMAPAEVTTRIDEFGLILEDAQVPDQQQQLGPFQPVHHTDRLFWVRSRDSRSINPNLVDGLQNYRTDLPMHLSG